MSGAASSLVTGAAKRQLGITKAFAASEIQNHTRSGNKAVARCSESVMRLMGGYDRHREQCDYGLCAGRHRFTFVPEEVENMLY